jgi:hypothetical protein
MANKSKKISELPSLDIASLDTTYVVGISGSTTYKISVNKLTSSLDTTFATDLVTAALSSSLDGKLSTSSFNQYTASFTASVASGTISGSSQLTSSFDQRYVVSGSITQTTWDNIANKPNDIVSSSTQISDLGFVTGSYTTINSFNSLTQSFNSISQSFTTISGSVGSIDFSGINAVTASYLAFTQSFNTYTASISTASLVTSISNLNTFTASQSTSSLVNRLTAIESVSGSWITESETGSFLTSLNGAISSSEQVLGNSGVYSSSAQINGNIYSAGSSVTIQDLLVGAGTTFGKITTDGNKYISVMPTYNVESVRFWTNGNVTIQDAGTYVDNGYRLEVSGSTRIVGSFDVTGGITGSTNFDTIVNKPTLISGSSQLTSSFDTRYTLSGSVQNIELPSNLVSGSSQLTSSLDSRYLQSGSSSSSDSITFNRTAGINVTEGQMAWNNSDGTLDIGLNFGDVVLQVGQEQHFVVRNETGTTISNGTAVYASGLSAGSKRIEVSPFTANGTTDEVRFLGLATHNISDGVNGVVSSFGYVRGLDTRGTSTTAISVGDETWAEGDILYAHPTAAGKLTKVAPKNKITVAMVTTRHQTTGVLFVRPSSFGHIDDLHDVQINTGSLVTGSMLEWNGDYFVNNNTFSSSVNSRINNITTGSLVTTSSFNSYTASISTASLVTSITNLNTFTASQSTASLVTSISNLNTFTSSLTSSITSVSGTFTDLTINGSRVNANGVITTDYINAGRISSDQTSMGNGSDIIFNSSFISSGISLNTSTGVFTLTAGKTYKLFAELSFANFSDFTNGYILYDWVDATTNTRLDTSGRSAGVGEHLNRNTNEFNATSTTLIYRPTTNQTVKVRIVEGVGTVTVRQSIGTKAIIEQINSSFALNTISGGINYVQTLGARVTGVTTTGVTIITGSITTTGKPVEITVTGDANPVAAGTSWTRLQLFRDNTGIGNIIQVENSANLNVPYCLNVIDTPSAGTYTYSMRTVSAFAGTLDFGEHNGPVLTAKELGSLTIITDTNNTFTGNNTFNNTTTFASAGGDEGGEIQFGVPVTNTILQNRVTVDVWQNRLRIFEGSANANGVYIDLSKPITGNNNEITYKASGIVNAGTFVTLDNIKATVTTTGQRGLSLATVSGTFTCNIGGNYAGASVGASGYSGTATITTSASTSIFGWGFTATGDFANYIITDTTNSRAYRIIIQIGASFNNNLVSIERLH